MKSLEELAALREQMKNKVAMRQDNSAATRVVVGMATCGIAAGARPVLSAFVEEVNRRTLAGTPFRDAYRQVGMEIEQGQFEFEGSQLHHTHEGSI